MAELTARCFDRAMLEMGPTQLNIPRDFFYGDIECDDTAADAHRARAPAASRAWTRPPSCCAAAKFPVILCRRRRDHVGRRRPKRSSSRNCCGAPVVNSYLHNDSFPAQHPLWCGPLGYQGSKAAMKLIAKADVCWRWARGWGLSARCRSTGSTTGRRTPRSSRSTPTRRMLGLVKHDLRSASAAMPGRPRAALIARLKGGTLAASASTRRAPRRHRSRESRVGDRTRRLDHESDAWSIEVAKGLATCIRARCCASSRRRCPAARHGLDRHRQHLLGLKFATCASTQPRIMFAAMSFGNCGYAFPTIIGAKVAAPDRPAVAYVGDGAWGMSFGEILTCVRENIPRHGGGVQQRPVGRGKEESRRFLRQPLRRRQSRQTTVLGGSGQSDGRRRRACRELARRRPCPRGCRRGAVRRQDHGAGDDGDARARRPVPSRCAALPVRHLEKYKSTAAKR